MSPTTKKRFFGVIAVAFFIGLAFLPKDCTCDRKTDTVETKTDTIWRTVHDTVIKKIKLTSYKIIPAIGPEFIPGDNVDTCTIRFNKLKDKFSVQRTYADTLKFPQLGIEGDIVVIDTIWKNDFKGKRKYINNLKVPIVTNTVTVTKEAKPVTQLYVGANLFADQNKIQLFTPGLVLKTKSDLLIQANVGVNFDGSITYGAGLYKKISFKKKK